MMKPLGLDHVVLRVRVNRYGAFGAGPSIYIRDPDDYTIELKPRAG